MKDNARISVVLASDDNYFRGLLVTAFTIAKNCSRPRDLLFYILDGGISDSNKRFLRDLLARYGCQTWIIDVANEKTISGFRPYHGSTMTYARLLLPDLLPSVEKVVYSDVDVLWLADIALLWNVLNTDSIIHCVPPNPHAFPQDRSVEAEWMNNHGFQPRMERRFCAGVLVFNLRKFRDEGLHLKMLSTLVANHGEVPCNDETILNAFMFQRDDVGMLDFKWQIGMGNVKAIPPDCEFVLHFAADTPWKTIHANHHMLTDAILLWHKIYAAASGTTVWNSLRKCNSPFDIIAGRMFYLSASRCAFVRVILRVLMRLTGRSGGISCVMAFAVKSRLADMLRLYRRR